MDEKLKTAPHRQPDHPVDAIFPNRWSPRSMSGAHLSRETMLTLFEAAHWAPSSSNGQPWRFIYALRGGEAWPAFFALLAPKNQLWCANAGALIIMASKQDFEHNGKPNKTHSFDTGSAWMSLALQASMLGLVAHGMAGFDYGAALTTASLPDGYSVEAMCAIGHPGALDTLAEEFRAGEKPNGRKPVSELCFENHFPIS